LGNENNDKEITEMKSKAEKKNWTENAKLLFDKGIKKLERMHSFSPDYSVVYNHLDLLLELPWNDITTDNYDLQNAKQVLEDDHYGMQKIKNRIIEFLAVLKLKGDLKSPILCLLGPPGIGKTSLGRSIARALDRKYIRISLGGLHDESEIRGHRKTYIGAMPGRIIQSLKKCKTSNPVMILDEIDKIGNDFKGDPSSALLEVLDPEQNHSFYDNYLETEYDLSKVLFIATANNIQNIQPALRDRLEIIELSGYATEEKIEIAKKHLLPKQQEAHGLKDFHFNFPDKIYETIIQQYTRESGVRELDRKLATLLRYIAKEFVISNTIINDITEKDIKDILGISKFAKDIYKNIHVCGVVTGLAWTYTGGDILFIETILSKGKGNIQLTGNLGNVMKESAHTALSYLQANAEKWNIDNEKFTTNNIHIHVPEGATPKDGPSAGITMFTSIASAFTGRLVKPKLAMTGEITLRGQVIPVGGIKEKILAAKREGFKEIILCAQN
ncbi:MAG: endopeptidase La, partial [Sediminibacterium sp.]|nr:endopeptidase La [Sediminibacterium sp.]